LKLLWLTNSELPYIANHRGRTTYSGGWLCDMLQQISKKSDITLYVITEIVGDLYENVELDGVHYYSFNLDNSTEKIRKYVDEIKPDLIHIWGSEYAYDYEMTEISKSLGLIDKTVLSIQGLTHYYIDHFFTGLPTKVIDKHSFKELLGRPNIRKSRELMAAKGDIEVKTFRNLKHCIGRTDWDYACAKQMNPEINYHFCNETLRSGFYKKQWNYDACEKNTIFFSQSYYPVKGLHWLLMALPIVKQEIPDVKVRVLGKDIINKNSIKDRMRNSSYENYLYKLIKDNDLYDNVQYLGNLPEEKMIEEYCRANIFVSSSNIENSSNSIGEAMLLGLPVVASDVGGIKSLMEHNSEGIIYQETAYYMLAHHIIDLLQNSDKAIMLGQNARNRAVKTHNAEVNFETMLNIYKELSNE